MPEFLSDELVDTEVLSSELAFDGRVWGVRSECFAHGDGTITREFVDHTGAVAVLAMDDDERVLLIQQYRHPIRTREWELPAGLLDVSSELPLVAAQRELAEEADLVAAEWAVLSDFVPSPGGSNEHIRIYLARALSDTAHAFERTEEEADIVKRWASLDEIIEAVLERRIQNSILAIAVLTAQASMRRGWASLGLANEPWSRHPLSRSAST